MHSRTVTWMDCARPWGCKREQRRICHFRTQRGLCKGDTAVVISEQRGMPIKCCEKPQPLPGGEEVLQDKTVLWVKSKRMETVSTNKQSEEGSSPARGQAYAKKIPGNQRLRTLEKRQWDSHTETVCTKHQAWHSGQSGHSDVNFLSPSQIKSNWSRIQEWFKFCEASRFGGLFPRKKNTKRDSDV